MAKPKGKKGRTSKVTRKDRRAIRESAGRGRANPAGSGQGKG